MAVVGVDKIFEGERLSEDQKQVEHVLAYSVEVDDQNDGTIDVRNADDGTTSIPPVNSIEIDSGLRVKSKSVERDAENPHFFTVTITLNNAADDQQKSGNGTEKLSVDVRVTTELYEEVVYIDHNKKAVTNAAGQPFSNQPTKTYYDERVTITFKTAVVDQASIDACKGYTNSNAVTVNIRGYHRTFAVGTLKMVDSSVGTRVSETASLFDMAYVLMFRKDGWKRKIMNMGRMQPGSGGSGGLVAIVGKDGKDVTEDVPLDKNGKGILDGLFGVALKEKSDPTLAAGERCYIEFDLTNGPADYGTLLHGV
jgi:hypothetical protein